MCRYSYLVGKKSSGAALAEKLLRGPTPRTNLIFSILSYLLTFVSLNTRARTLSLSNSTSPSQLVMQL